MSTHVVEAVPFTLEPLPNSDFLSIAHVKGWQCVVRTDSFNDVERPIYIPIDSIVPDTAEFSFLENYRQPEAEIRAKVQTKGKSSIAPGQVKEGCVVRPVKERWHPRLGHVVLKSISDSYLLRREGTENH